MAIFSEKTCLKEVILKLHPFLRVLLCECEGDPTALGLKARDYLISEGIRPETIIKTGSCMKEILNFGSINLIYHQII